MINIVFILFLYIFLAVLISYCNQQDQDISNHINCVLKFLNNSILNLESFYNIDFDEKAENTTKMFLN